MLCYTQKFVCSSEYSKYCTVQLHLWHSVSVVKTQKWMVNAIYFWKIILCLLFLVVVASLYSLEHDSKRCDRTAWCIINRSVRGACYTS